MFPIRKRLHAVVVFCVDDVSCLPPGNEISQGVDFPLVFTSGSTKGKNRNKHLVENKTFIAYY